MPTNETDEMGVTIYFSCKNYVTHTQIPVNMLVNKIV